MSVSPQTIELINADLNVHPLYGNRLANHFPMALVSLDKLGADFERQLKFRADYSNKLELFIREELSLDFDFNDSLGRSDMFPQYLSYFDRYLKLHSLEETISKHIDKLIPGISASAFHALIRLAFAIESHNYQEVSFALAYWAAEFQYLGSPHQKSDRSLLEILNQHKDTFEGFKFRPGIIVDKMNQVAATLEWENEAVIPQDLKLELIAKFAVQFYQTDSDFTLLHGVTGTHALRIILPFVKNKRKALEYFWIAYWVAYQTTKTWRPSTYDEAISDISIEEMKRKATKSNNDHTIKLVYSCLEEFRHYG
ncbi:MAG: questin oxidase family protein, partial [Kangiellaceae bacterium]|nr:questin oxidase family protein [Kangiellaceae bacterium]